MAIHSWFSNQHSSWGTVRAFFEDWQRHVREDIAINIENGQSYIYLGDIGGNVYRNLRNSLKIYKFEEPEMRQGRDIEMHSNQIRQISVKYPNNERYDCEAMAVDPQNNDILLFTKTWEKHQSHVFRVPHGSGNPKTLEFIKTLRLKEVTGENRWMHIFKNKRLLTTACRCGYISIWRHAGHYQFR